MDTFHEEVGFGEEIVRSDESNFTLHSKLVQQFTNRMCVLQRAICDTVAEFETVSEAFHTANDATWPNGTTRTHQYKFPVRGQGFLEFDTKSADSTEDRSDCVQEANDLQPKHVADSAPTAAKNPDVQVLDEDRPGRDLLGSNISGNSADINSQPKPASEPEPFTEVTKNQNKTNVRKGPPSLKSQHSTILKCALK